MNTNEPRSWPFTDDERAAIQQSAQRIADDAPPLTDEQAAITARVFTAARSRTAPQAARTKRPA